MALFGLTAASRRFEISPLRQGEGCRSASSGDPAAVHKYRALADGGKLAAMLEPYGAYAHGGVLQRLGAWGAS